MNYLKFSKIENQFNTELWLPSVKIYSDKNFNKKISVKCYILQKIRFVVALNLSQQ